MKRLIASIMGLLIASLACNLSASSTPPSTIQATSTAKPLSTPTIPAKPPNLSHDPLYWFGPLPPLPVVEGRPFIGSEDFLQLFEPEAEWQTAADRIQVFKLYGEWVSNHPADVQLKKVIADLNRRGLAIAIETGPLNPEAGCGNGIEGFATIESGLQMAGAIKASGGTLHFITLDEPYYYGHFYDGPNACHWTAEKIARDVDKFIKAVKNIFPNVIVGDTEPLAGPAGAKEYQDWLNAFYEVNGYHLAFIHMDIDWSRPKWTEEVRAIQEHASKIDVPVGVIYNGNAFDKTDEAFLSATGERVKKLEIGAGVQPDHIIFQSWNDKPDRVIPDTEPYTFTGFINRYFTNKENLGYRREGQGANIALEKQVRFSNQTSDLTGALALDGDFGTLWNSGGGPTQWIEINLGGSYNILEMRLTISQFPRGKTVHRVLGKSANGQFILITTFEGDTTDGETLFFTPLEPIPEIQFIRVETIETPSWVAWREIEIIDAGK